MPKQISDIEAFSDEDLKLMQPEAEEDISSEVNFNELLAQKLAMQSPEGELQIDLPAGNPEEMASSQSLPPLMQQHADAMKQRDKQQLYANLLSSFQGGVENTTKINQPSFKANMAVAENLHKQAGQPVEDIHTQQVIQKYQSELDKRNLDITNAKKTGDPNSAESQMAQAFALELNPNLNPESIKQQSAATLYKYMKPMQELVVQKLKGDMYAKQLALQERRLGQGDDRIGLLNKGEDRKQAQFENQKVQKDELSDKQTSELSGYDEALVLLTDAGEMKKNVDTGLLTAASDKGREMIGKQDPKVSDLRMKLGQALAAKIKELSGTAVSDKERAFLASISLPDIKDDDKQFNAKLKTAVDSIQKARQVRIENFRKQGKNPSSFEKKQGSGFPMQVRKDGKVATVKDQAELDEAKSEGWAQ